MQPYDAAPRADQTPLPFAYAARLVYFLFFSPSQFRTHVESIEPEAVHTGDVRLLIWAARREAEFRRLLAYLAAMLAAATLATRLAIVYAAPHEDEASVRSIILRLATGLIVVFFIAYGVSTLTAWWAAMADALIAGEMAGLLAALLLWIHAAPTYATTLLAHFAIGFFFVSIIALGAGLARALLNVAVASLFAAIFDQLYFARAQGNSPWLCALLSLAFLAGATRLPLYAVQAISAALCYRKTRQATDHEAIEAFLRAPVCADDLLMLPQPFLAAFLLSLCRRDLQTGLECMCRVMRNPAQQWAAVAASRALLERDRLPFFVFTATLRQAARSRLGTDAPADRLIAELASAPVTVTLASLGDSFVRAITRPLRPVGHSPYAALAAVLLQLLKGEDDPLRVAVAELERARDAGLPHADYFLRNFIGFYAARRCLYVADIARCSRPIKAAAETPNPLLPAIQNLFVQLGEVVKQAAWMTERAQDPHWRRLCMAQALAWLARAEAEAARLDDPERRQFRATIAAWRRIFLAEGLPLVYVTDRPLAPADGHLFVGRERLCDEISAALGTRAAIALLGDELAGKTSVLLHLSARQQPARRLVVFDALLSYGADEAEFLAELAAALADAARDAGGWRVPALPKMADLSKGAYETFGRFLRALEAGAPAGAGLVLAVDNFQSLDMMVQQGRLSPAVHEFLLAQVEGGTATRFLFVCNPHVIHFLTPAARRLLAAAWPIHVGHLTPAACAELITMPMGGEFILSYSPDLVARITELTGGHPYLIQEVCRNLIDAVDTTALPAEGTIQVSSNKVEAAIVRTLSTAGPYFADLCWDSRSYPQRVALAVIGDAAQSTHHDDVHFSLISKYLGDDGTREVLAMLIEAGILEAHGDERAPSYRFRLPIGLLWFASNHPLRSVLSSLAIASRE